MIRLIGLVALLALPAFAGIDDELNADGNNIFRLARVNEPVYGEVGAHERVVNEVNAFIERMENSPLIGRSPEYGDHLRAARHIHDIFKNEVLFRLYIALLHAIRNKGVKIRANPDGSPEVTFSLTGKNSGMTHLSIMEGFEDWLEGHPDFNSPNPPSHTHFFDVYLEGQGITGFGAHAQKTAFANARETRRGVGADISRNWSLQASGRRVFLGCGALIVSYTALVMGIGGWFGHTYFSKPPPETRIEKQLPADSAEETPSVNAQKRADTQAESRGARAAKLLDGE